MSKLILRSKLSLGDIVLLTAAVRDLHRAHPGQFITDVRSCFPDLWQANPHLTPLDEYAPDVRVLDCTFPMVQRSEESASHCLHGFMDFFREALGLRVVPTEFRGDIHLSAEESRWPSPVQERTGHALPYWLICAGGKDDFTTKWWDAARYQQVVNHFAGRILFVQVGDMAHHHPPLRGVLDLRGQTGVRDLVRLTHHAQGVLCGVTGLMHLAAAVPRPGGLREIRPCVVVAGGREPAHWEAYPGHQFIHTIGALPCCAGGGCWKSRVQPLGDGDEKDQSLCTDVRGPLPRCMDLITAAEVAQRMERYFDGGAAACLSVGEVPVAARVLAAAAASKLPESLSVFNAAGQADEYIRTLSAFPGGFEGRGIVICGGGVRMFTNAWVCLRQLRRLGCTLPIELWHWGEAEMDDVMRSLVAPFGVECIDGAPHAAPGTGGHVSAWAMKPLAMIRSRFREVLLLDADNVPVQNPEFLFDAPPYREAGAVLWPDFERLKPENRAWKIFGVPYRDEPEVESGQVLVDKARCWAALQLCLWYNDHASFFYRHVYGDKETFHFAFRKLGLPYAMPETPVTALPGVMCQHDFEGRRLFQHRNRAKWRLFADNAVIAGFEDEEACRSFLRDLAGLWNGRIRRPGGPGTSTAAAVERAPLDLVATEDPPLTAIMTSCAERQVMLAETLALLRRSDWGDRPVRLFLDEHRFHDREENLAHNGWCALRGALALGAEHILYLEDDLDFNRHFLHNLLHWPRLRAGQITLATLYNPDFTEVGWDVPPTAFALNPRTFFGSQALIISRPAALYILEHWFEAPQPVDVKMAHLAARLKWPLFCHNPSLVQHRGRQSVVGSGFHQARDFDREWRAPSR